LNYSELKPGQIISTQQFSLDRTFVDDYLKSTSESTDGLYTEFAPPMSLGALAVRAAITDLKIPGGTLHLTQEVEFFTPVPIGETISCSAELLQNSVRAGMRILVIALSIENGAGLQLMSGKSTITVPN
jgi:acyl dehydratase